MRQITYSEEAINSALHALDTLEVSGIDNMNTIMTVFNMLTTQGSLIEQQEEQKEKDEE